MIFAKHDWTDLALMALGACVGVAIFGYLIAPAIGMQFVGGTPWSYMLAAVSGTLCGFALRLAVSQWRSR